MVIIVAISFTSLKWKFVSRRTTPVIYNRNGWISGFFRNFYRVDEEREWPRMVVEGISERKLVSSWSVYCNIPFNVGFKIVINIFSPCSRAGTLQSLGTKGCSNSCEWKQENVNN